MNGVDLPFQHSRAASTAEPGLEAKQMRKALGHPELAVMELSEMAVQARRASDVLKALSHESRLMILWLLSAEERTVSELEELLCLPQAAVSQQLARLRLDRLVEARREGRMIRYSISNPEISVLVGNMFELLCRPVEGGS